MGRYNRKYGKGKGWWVTAGDNALLCTEADLAFARVLIGAREAAGLSRAQLGVRLHLTRSTIWRIETGKSEGLSWLRYTPKVLAWLKACSHVVRIEAVPREWAGLEQEMEDRSGPRKKK